MRKETLIWRLLNQYEELILVSDPVYSRFCMEFISDADPMGLFLSMAPCEDFAYGGYLKCTPPVPFYYLLKYLHFSDKLDPVVSFQVVRRRR